MLSEFFVHVCAFENVQKVFEGEIMMRNITEDVIS